MNIRMDISKIVYTTPQFNQRFSAWMEHIPFAFYLIELLKPKIFVELGTHNGNSFFSFCQAIKQLNLESKAYAVDHWKGDEHSGKYHDEIYQFVKNINTTNFSEFSSLLKMSFDEANLLFEEKSIDLLHIDGLHTYEAVKHDFDLWLPKMSNKGVILLHDIDVKNNEFGVWKLMKELKAIYPSAELSYGYGLGIICVGDNVNSNFLHFINEIKGNDFLRLFFQNIGSKLLLEFENKLLKKENQELKSILNGGKIDHRQMYPRNNFKQNKIQLFLNELSRVFKNNPITIKKYIKIINASGLFDENYYLENNQDLKNSVINPIRHYLLFGGFEGRSPSAKFDTKKYIKDNPNVISENINPLIHFILQSKKDEKINK